MADHQKIQEVMEGFQNNLAGQLQKIQPQTNLKLNMILQQCYQRSNENHDRFSQCVLQSNRKLNDVMEGFQFKMLYLSRYAKGCLEKSGTKQCTQKVTQQGKSIVDGLLKQVEKL